VEIEVLMGHTKMDTVNQVVERVFELGWRMYMWKTGEKKVEIPLAIGKISLELLYGKMFLVNTYYKYANSPPSCRLEELVGTINTYNE
jgi:hypothetical protein